ncbi:hypothetical protein Desku_1867 [Desulfofundulus kuznetsovii DSM 6115]|uniref:DUF2953 domain-containing protein n=1 Tax=Desulfofundulus kuznetsovii (strain DSM 6115 / VKM B-1805 / 17) TaxID=760568 RepID=A0AAU8PQH6_DESK7|nr:hypothetical protein Desku_1867 [Desulfofundulus kuznetsovii DSM 6115]
MWLWWLILILFFLFCVLVVVPLNLELYYRRRGQDHCLYLVVSTWFDIKYQLIPRERLPKPAPGSKAVMKEPRGVLPEKEKKKSAGGTLKLFRRLMSYVHLGQRVWPALEFLLHRTELRRFEWRTLVGLPDAAHTGMAVGGLWSIKGAVLTALYRLVSKKSVLPEVAVVPHFTGSSFGLLIHCIFTVRLGHIMVTAVKLAFVFIRDGLRKALPFTRLLKG